MAGKKLILTLLLIYGSAAILYSQIINEELIIVSEPDMADSTAYISGFSGAVQDSILGTEKIRITNLRTQDVSSIYVHSTGGFPLMDLGADVGDQVKIELYRDRQIVGDPVHFTVPESQSPEVISAKPTNGDKDIVLDKIIEVHFSEPVDTNTINSISFTLKDNHGILISGDMGFFKSNTIIYIDPAIPLEPLTGYTITVTAEVKDQQGLSLDNTFTATFTTGTELTQSRIINVPADISSIQGGIDLAADGYTVLVQPGTYIETINFNGKNIVVGSLTLTSGDTSYISQTVIDGDSSGGVVTFVNGEDSTTVLTGFTIRNGRKKQGGGIYCSNSSPNFTHIYIIDNQSDLGAGIYCSNSMLSLSNVILIKNSALDGGGIYCYNSSPKLTNVTIHNNIADYGGGIFCNFSTFDFSNVTISGNTADYGGGVNCKNSDPSLMNVNISNNNAEVGGGIYCQESSSPNFMDVNIHNNTADYGGGIYCRNNSRPSLTNIKINNNSAKDGGGIYCRGSSSTSLTNVTISANLAYGDGGGICCRNNSRLIFDNQNRCNIYLNQANQGKDLYNNSSENISVIVDTFTVRFPNEYFTSPMENFTFDILNAKIEQATADLYVSASGNNDNSGLSALEPLQTIEFAFSKIYSDSINPLTIYLTNGRYSSSTNGERFPLFMQSYVSLSGESRDSVILDAEYQEDVINCRNSIDFILEKMTITGGVGYGISCVNKSRLSLTNVTISGNGVEDYNEISRGGGGIYCSDSSTISLSNIIISNNSAAYVVCSRSVESGGGIYCSGNSNLSLSNVTIRNNFALKFGGGIYCSNSNLFFDSENRSNIYQNTAREGYDLYNAGLNIISVILDTFTVLNPTEDYAYPIESFSFEILQGIVSEINEDAIKLPIRFALEQNYPNPFNPKTVISYQVGANGHSPVHVNLSIYNILGQKAAMLVSEKQMPGTYQVEWDATEFTNGIYIYKLYTDEGYTHTKKLVIIK